MNLKVCKFGGTSMAEKKTIDLVKNIILSDETRRFVIVSAPGKRFASDIKITDLLYECFYEKVRSGSCAVPFARIKKRFYDLVNELELDLDIGYHLDRIQEEIDKSATPDFAASRGEYLSALITSEILGMEFIDAAEIIKFTAKGVFDAETTNDIVSHRLSLVKGAVIPGFYGAMPDGSIKTFSRGGSDFTGAIIARGVMADVYENWTDVDGFMTTDPRIVKDPLLIDVLSYEELRELSYMGASVLHPESIFPLQGTEIPINIRNTFNPSGKGTLIVKDTSVKEGRLVTGIAGRKGFTTILIKKAMMNAQIGFCRQVLSVLENYHISLEHMPTGIDTMSLIIPDSDLEQGMEFELVSKIRGKVNPDSIFVYKDISLIAVVGHGMSHQTGTAAKVFTALAKADVNVKMIDQGSSELNIIIGVNTSDFEKAISAIYGAFFG